MSKQNYVVNCYTCQHNGQETCKGCRTILVGEDEPYENWQLREDLEQKDNKIADLEAKLADKDEQIKILEDDRFIMCNTLEMYAEKCKKYEQQLAKKEKKIEVLKLDYDFVTKQYNELIEKGNYIINQDKISFAVEKLVGVQKYIDDNAVYIEEVDFGREIKDFIYGQIKQLKEKSGEE